MRGVQNNAHKISMRHGVLLMDTHIVCRDAYTDGEHFVPVCGCWIERFSAKQANPWWMATCTACVKGLAACQERRRVESLTNAIGYAVFFLWFQPAAWDA